MLFLLILFDREIAAVELFNPGIRMHVHSAECTVRLLNQASRNNHPYNTKCVENIGNQTRCGKCTNQQLNHLVHSDTWFTNIEPFLKLDESFTLTTSKSIVNYKVIILTYNPENKLINVIAKLNFVHKIPYRRAHAWPSGRVRARAKVSCIHS